MKFVFLIEAIDVYMWKKQVIKILWLLAGIGVIVLLGAAMQKKEHKRCKDVKIEIKGTENDVFIDEKDVMNLINSSGNIVEKNLIAINLKALENALKKNLWIKNAEMFFDNNQLLHANIEERTPVARVFTIQGNSFYVDSNLFRLPLSEKLTARVPVFTSFPSDNKILSQSDSTILKSVVKMADYILADSFWMAQVSQINITSHATFEMIPTIGDQVIELGNIDNIDSKFKRLFIFYKQALLQNGINKYSRIDIQYDRQVVAVNRGTVNNSNDSVQAMQQFMGVLVNQNNAAKKDSVLLGSNAPLAKQSTILKDSLTAKELGKKINKNVIVLKQNKVINKSLSVSHRPVVVKEPGVKTNQPKAVMQKEKQ